MIWPFRQPDLRVLVVCTANVCRSPAAEAILGHELRQAGLHRKVAVSSAGTDVGAPGRAPDPRVVAILGEMGVRVRGIRAAQITPDMLRSVDCVWVMERAHLSRIHEDLEDFADVAELFEPGGLDVPDPYFGSKLDVRSAVERIGEIARARVEDLRAQLG